MRLIPFLAIAWGGLCYAGGWVTAHRRKPEPDADERALDEYLRLVREASDAAELGLTEQAQILAHAAERVAERFTNRS